MQRHHSFESGLYQVAGYSFTLRFSSNRELSIAFPETTVKYERTFIAKLSVVLLSKQMKCGTMEVKQKDLTRGCNKIITFISDQDVDEYSVPRYTGDTMKELTFEVYLYAAGLDKSGGLVAIAAEISHKPPKIMPRGVTMLSILSSVAIQYSITTCISMDLR